MPVLILVATATATGLCQDDLAYRDKDGYSCHEWRSDDFNCQHYNGYSDAELQDVRHHCPVSCRLCIGACYDDLNFTSTVNIGKGCWWLNRKGWRDFSAEGSLLAVANGGTGCVGDPPTCHIAECATDLGFYEACCECGRAGAVTSTTSPTSNCEDAAVTGLYIGGTPASCQELKHYCDIEDAEKQEMIRKMCPSACCDPRCSHIGPPCFSTPTTTSQTSPTTTPASGRLECSNGGRLVPSDEADCDGQVSLINAVLDACAAGEGAGTLTCADTDNGKEMVVDHGCTGASDLLGAAISEFSVGSVAAPSVSCNQHSYSVYALLDCSTIVSLINEMINSYLDGPFRACVKTTMTTTESSSQTTTISTTASISGTTTASVTATSSATTSATTITPTTSGTSTYTTTGTTSSTMTSSVSSTGTSTGSTTPSTTPTSSPQRGRLVCDSNTISTTDSLLCHGQTGLLRSLLNVCGQERLRKAVDQVGCKAGVALGVSGDACEVVAQALVDIVSEYSRGTIQSQVGCTSAGILGSSSSAACEETVGQLNNAIDSYLDGSFLNCEMTSPTTTRTSTPTRSVTTTLTRTVTTTVTSSATATPSTSNTGSPTTTRTSTLSSSGSSTLTTSPTKTGTTSVTISETTTVATSVTTSETTSPSTSMSTSVTTSKTLSPTTSTTASTSPTSSQSSSGTTSESTSPTSSVTSSATFSPSTSPTITRSTTETSTRSTTATSSPTTTQSETPSTTATMTPTTTVTSSSLTTSVSSTRTSTQTSSHSSTMTSSGSTTHTTSQTITATTTPMTTPTSTILFASNDYDYTATAYMWGGIALGALMLIPLMLFCFSWSRCKKGRAEDSLRKNVVSPEVVEQKRRTWAPTDSGASWTISSPVRQENSRINGLKEGLPPLMSGRWVFGERDGALRKNERPSLIDLPSQDEGVQLPPLDPLLDNKNLAIDAWWRRQLDLGFSWGAPLQ